MTVGIIRRLAIVAAMLGSATALSFGAGSAAVAATPPVGSFPVWTGNSPTAATAFSGQLSPAAGGGTIGVTTNGTGAQVAESGTASFLGASTGFGQKFGSSRYQSYLTIGLASGNADSTTVVSLPDGLPIGWGFALGDVDADMVSIDGTRPGGAALSATDLNPQDTGGTPLLNYCDNASPKPSACGPGTSFPDHPWWCPVPTGVAPCASATRPRTVEGNGVDTKGAYDWFVPTVAVKTLSLTYQRLAGSPSFQLWIVVPAPATTVTGQVDSSDGTAIPPGTTLAVTHADGTPVLDLLDQPVSVPVAADGAYGFSTEQGDYRLGLDPPDGYQASTPATLAFTASGDAITLPTLALAATPPAAPAAPTLAATGADARPLFGLAAGFLVVGALLSALALRRRGLRSRPRA